MWAGVSDHRSDHYCLSLLCANCLSFVDGCQMKPPGIREHIINSEICTWYLHVQCKSYGHFSVNVCFQCSFSQCLATAAAQYIFTV